MTGHSLHTDLTHAIIGAAYEVHGTLGAGFLESVYEKALAQELTLRGIPFKRQVRIPISYKNTVVGEHVLDLLVDGKVIVELKAINEISDIHTSIILSYLTATRLSVALLLNFAKPSLDIKRIAR